MPTRHSQAEDVSGKRHCAGQDRPSYPVGGRVDLLNVAVDGAGKDARQTAHGRVVVRPVHLGNVDQRGNRLYGCGWPANHMQAAWQQPGLDLHQPAQPQYAIQPKRPLQAHVTISVAF